MKRLLAFAGLLILILSSCSDDKKNNPINPGENAKEIKFAVIADPHLYAKELGTEGATFYDAAQKSSTLYSLSEEILSKCVDELISDKTITHVIILGDLTKDGENASMMLLRTYLDKLEAAGKTVIVMYGDRDILNPNSRKYSGSFSSYAENISYDWYNANYSEFQPPTVKYKSETGRVKIYEPIPGLWFMFINSIWANNDWIDDSEIAWVNTKLSEAKTAGTPVIAFTQLNVIPQYIGQSYNLPNSPDLWPSNISNMTSSYEKLGQTLNGVGVRAVFTAGAHVTNTTQYNNGFWDIATGSLTSGLLPYRVVTVNPKEYIKVSTNAVLMSQDIIEMSAEHILSDFTPNYIKQLAKEQSIYSEEELQEYMTLIGSAYLTHIIGNEMQYNFLRQEDVAMFRTLFYYQLGDFIYNITHDPDGNVAGKDDHELTINLK